jgi:DNA-binding transcriptional regulator YhcF (GntR family)
MEFRKNQTIYLQIADYICENIIAGEWTKGDKIQSVREMATTTQVNPNTVMRTYSYLQDLGIIFNQRGIGYFVADDALQKTKAFKKEAFVKEFLPEVFKTMDLLDINFEDLEAWYKKSKNGTS